MLARLNRGLCRLLDAARMRGPRADAAMRRHPHGLIRDGDAVTGLWFGFRVDGDPRIHVVAGHGRADGPCGGFRFATAARGRALAAEVRRRVAAGEARPGTHFVDAALWAVSAASLDGQVRNLHGKVLGERAAGNGGYWSAECPAGTMPLSRRLGVHPRDLTPASRLLATSETAHMQGLATFPSHDVPLVEAALPRTRRMATVAAAFLDTLDGEALAWLADAAVADWLGDAGWDALCGRAAPDCLGAAIARHRWLRDVAVRAHAAAPSSFHGPNPPGPGAMVRAAGLDRMVHPRAADLMGLAHDAAEVASDTAFAVEIERCGTGLGGTAPDDLSPAMRILRSAGSACPMSRLPDTVGEWRAFMRAVPVVVQAAKAVPAGMTLELYLDAHDGWDAFRRRTLRAATGKAPEALDDGRGAAPRRWRENALTDMVADRIHDMDDLARRLAEQVVVPACILAGARETGEGISLLVARSMAYGTASLVSALAASREWHLRLDRMLLDIEAADPILGGANSWEQGLPDAVVGGVAVSCIANTHALRDEGRHGANADGSQGLGHCVGTFAPRCIDGRSRILSLRVPGDGPPVRLATAEVSMPCEEEAATRWAARILQVRGHGNGDAPPAAAAALDAYLQMLDDGTLVASPVPRAPRDGLEAAVRRAGYDFRHPGAFEAVWAVWKPYVRRRVRNRGAVDILAEVRRHEALPLSAFQDTLAA